jgi:hypothetical protein
MEISEGLSGESTSPLAPPVAVFGLSRCDVGWLGVLVRPSRQTSLHLGSTLQGLVEQVREQESLGAVGLADAEHPDAVAWLSTRPTLQVVETAATAGTRAQRRELLAAAGAIIPMMYGGMGFGEDELLAACEAAVEAARLWS